MLDIERHILILERLAHKNVVSIRDLCKELQVSRETVRKDIRYLDSQNKLTQVRGGAVATHIKQ